MQVMVDRNKFDKRLSDTFDCTENERDSVIRQATRLERSGIYESEGGNADEFTIDGAISSMQVAPDHLRITSKWNYWMGLLDAGDTDFSQFKC
jgi:hypothetical protein